MHTHDCMDKKRWNAGQSVLGSRLVEFQAKIEMYSRYERQKDKRSYGDRHHVFQGPTFLYPAERVVPTKIVSWNEEGLPQYDNMDGAPAAAEGEE